MRLMTLFFLVAGMLLSLAVPCLAGPFLVSDPYDPATMSMPKNFEVKMDGGDWVISKPDPVQSVPNGVRLRHDLANVTDGEHNVEIRACNEWGCSSTVFFAFSKGLPGPPSQIKLEFVP